MGPLEGDKTEAHTHFKVARFIMEAGECIWRGVALLGTDR